MLRRIFIRLTILLLHVLEKLSYVNYIEKLFLQVVVVIKNVNLKQKAPSTKQQLKPDFRNRRPVLASKCRSSVGRDGWCTFHRLSLEATQYSVRNFDSGDGDGVYNGRFARKANARKSIFTQNLTKKLQLNMHFSDLQSAYSLVRFVGESSDKRVNYTR